MKCFSVKLYIKTIDLMIAFSNGDDCLVTISKGFWSEFFGMDFRAMEPMFCVSLPIIENKSTHYCIRRKVDAKLNEVVRFASRFEGNNRNKAPTLKVQSKVLRSSSFCTNLKSTSSPATLNTSSNQATVTNTCLTKSKLTRQVSAPTMNSSFESRRDRTDRSKQANWIGTEFVHQVRNVRAY